MLDKALLFLATELNDYFGRSFQLLEDRAVLSAHLNPDGTPATAIANKVSVTLVNLAPESTVRNLQAERSGNGELRLNPAIKLNLWVLFAANFGDYDEALKFLSSTLAFFQGRPVFTPQNSPRLDRSFDRLVVELETLTYHELSNLWGVLGSKYTPSALYKVKLVTIQDGAVQDRTPALTGLGVNPTPRAAP
ncbi:DUF4255 domain-containing protein [Hymenobacter ruricola]|uniref:DUF4255 domain-containing protein n=1 Tax=Hymenobacter ruricola TaxID=2791023 RepID=A0ABS0I6Z1_9BACT|nr:DUF4255 domain-containing protein [Hymenobacter ruricola]MBF9222664.1 DUF4255 domain-containing protein [Hymenobacter ruricola]